MISVLIVDDAIVGSLNDGRRVSYANADVYMDARRPHANRLIYSRKLLALVIHQLL